MPPSPANHNSSEQNKNLSELPGAGVPASTISYKQSAAETGRGRSKQEGHHLDPKGVPTKSTEHSLIFAHRTQGASKRRLGETRKQAEHYRQAHRGDNQKDHLIMPGYHLRTGRPRDGGQSLRPIQEPRIVREQN